MFNLESMEKKHCLSNNIRIIHISLIDFEQEFEKHQNQAVLSCGTSMDPLSITI